MVAIHKAHQSNVDKAVAWLTKYNTYNTLRDEHEDDKEYKKYDNLCYSSFNKFLEYMGELPKREQKQIYNSELY